MMKKLLIIFGLFLSLCAEAQYIYPTHFKDCNSSQFALEGKEMYVEKNSRLLLKEVLGQIDKEILSKAKGEIYIQLLLDSMGMPCVLSIKNELKGKIKKVDFKQIFDTHTQWISPMDDGKKITACLLLKLTFTKEKIIIQRIGYNSKVGHVELDRFDLKK